MSREVNGLSPNRGFWGKIDLIKQTISQKIKQNPSDLFVKYAILLSVCIVLLLIDQLTKTFIFEVSPFNSAKGAWELDPSKTINYGFIGFRSVYHYGVTIIPFKTKSVIVFIQIISVIIMLAILVVPLFTDNLFVLIVIGFILAGDMGNMLDRFIFEGKVKDIIWTPFIERWRGRVLGTYNFADTYIITACILIALNLIYSIFVEKDEKKKLINNKEMKLHFIQNQKNNFMIRKFKKIARSKWKEFKK
ncbi:signal peptidase II [Mycoplasmopsis lipofaciens]|uniref:signal peptidase II n=1 Tax=Mycoplasmopsis lipofaciens TaxID=114884 RepID=UPI000690F80F|nr:signal peptidase II [Mycoplasmopsis lipofaciens]